MSMNRKNLESDVSKTVQRFENICGLGLGAMSSYVAVKWSPDLIPYTSVFFLLPAVSMRLICQKFLGDIKPFNRECLRYSVETGAVLFLASYSSECRNLIWGLLGGGVLGYSIKDLYSQYRNTKY